MDSSLNFEGIQFSAKPWLMYGLVYMLYICTTGITLGSNQLAMESGIKSHQMVWCEDRVPKMSKRFVRVFLIKWLIYVGDIPYVQTHTHMVDI